MNIKGTASSHEKERLYQNTTPTHIHTHRADYTSHKNNVVTVTN